MHILGKDTKNLLIRVREKTRPFFVVLSIQLFMNASTTFAANLLTPPTNVGTKPEDFVGIVCQVAAFFYYIAIAVSIIMAIIAAYRYMASSGNESQVSEAHKTLTYAAVGVAVALISWGLPSIVAFFLNDSSGPVAC